MNEVDRKLKCKFCGGHHVRGKQHCKAAGEVCKNCGKVGHFSKVCNSKPANPNHNQDRRVKKNEANDVKQGEVKQSKQEANAAWDGNWACRVDGGAQAGHDHVHGGIDDEEQYLPLGDYQSFKSFENKYSEFYGPDFVAIYKQASLYSGQKEALGKDNKNEAKNDTNIPKIKPKKVGKPTLVKNIPKLIPSPWRLSII